MKEIALIDPSFLPHCGCHIRLSLLSGSALVLVGENGIGKSTLLNRLGGMLPNQSRVVIEQRASEYFFDRKLKVIKEFFLSSQLPKMNHQSFLHLWEKFNLHLKEDRLLSELSGGESQALKLTLGLCKEADVYLLDEPSQFLDSERKQILIEYLSILLVRNKSLLIIEHNLDWLPKEVAVQKLVIQNAQLVLGDRWTIS